MIDPLSRLALAATVLLILLVVILPSAAYQVDQRELAVVLQFGKPVAERLEPGLYFKLPVVQEVVRLPATRQFWGDDLNNPISDSPTKDEKKIEVVPWALWRIREPTEFVQRLVTMDEAERRVSQFVRGAIRDVISEYDLAELVRSTDRELTMYTTPELEFDDLEELGIEIPSRQAEVKLSIEFGRPEILDQIKQLVRERLTSGADKGGRGIELVDIGISRIDFVQSVRDKTFERWIAERNAIAAKTTYEGERLKEQIIAESEREVERIEGEGQRNASVIRGAVDAEIIEKYAVAIEEVGEFYTFDRTLKAYQEALNKDTRLILTTDSEFLGLIKRLEPPDGGLPSYPSAEDGRTAEAGAGSE